MTLGIQSTFQLTVHLQVSQISDGCNFTTKLFYRVTAPDPPNRRGHYEQIPFSDYEQQFSGFNRIRDTYINATRRVICYNQPIYNDVRVEPSEYLGMTLGVRDSTILTNVDPEFDQVAIKIVDDDGKSKLYDYSTLCIYLG